MVAGPASVQSLNELSRILPGTQEIFATIVGLAHQDRALAITTVALVERALEELIAARLIPLGPKDRKRLFQGEGPLSSLSAKTQIGYAIGSFNAVVRDDLDTLRSIRNAFAHATQHITFETPEVITVCRRLRLSNYIELHLVNEDSADGNCKYWFTTISMVLAGLFLQSAAEHDDSFAELFREFGISRKISSPSLD